VFNIGLPEFFLFGLVAIVFIGPERLPVVARWLGKQVARLRKAWREVQSEMSQDEDLREIQNAGRQLRNELKSVRSQIKSVGQSVTKTAGPDERPAAPEEADDEWEILRREGLFDVGLSPSPKPAVNAPAPAVDGEPASAEAPSEPPKEPEEGID
jgi:sec-independent protein translocase protein TatB